MDPSKVIFDVIVNFSSLQITGFAFTPKASVKEGTFFALPEFKDLQGRDQHWYRMIIIHDGNMEQPLESLHRTAVLEFPHEISKDMQFPEWPWIAAELTRSENTSFLVTSKKWNLLITAVEYQRGQHPSFFSDFMTATMKLNQVLKVDRMEEWYKRMASFDTWVKLLSSGYLEKTLNTFE